MRQWQGSKIIVGMMFALFFLAQPAAAEAPAGLIISAAASLTNVMQLLAKDFAQRNPGLSTTFNFGSTGDLLAQMSQGAPVDIFVSASAKHMDQAQDKGLILAESRKTFASNTLVLARPASSAKAVNGLLDLSAATVERIGIGKPETVPAGQYGKEALMAAGLWSAVEAKLIFGNSVRQVLDYLRRGEVDAALIYATDARVAKEQVTVVTALPDSRVSYPVALVKTTHDRAGALRFLDYLATDATRAILADQGFLLP